MRGRQHIPYLTLRDVSSLSHVLAMLLAGQSHPLLGRHCGRQVRYAKLNNSINKMNSCLGRKGLTNASKYPRLWATSLSSRNLACSGLSNPLYVAKQRKWWRRNTEHGHVLHRAGHDVTQFTSRDTHLRQFLSLRVTMRSKKGRVWGQTSVPVHMTCVCVRVCVCRRNGTGFSSFSKH